MQKKRTLGALSDRGSAIEDGRPMEDAQVDELRRWAMGLGNDPRPEVKAAAKAILLLSDDLRAARSQLLEERMILAALEARDSAHADGSGEVSRDLIRRLRSILRLRAGSPEA